MTMEDAAELAWHVQQYGFTADALERFEAKRIPRVTKILDHAKVSASCATCITEQLCVGIGADPSLWVVYTRSLL